MIFSHNFYDDRRVMVSFLFGSAKSVSSQFNETKIFHIKARLFTWDTSKIENVNRNFVHKHNRHELLVKKLGFNL